MVFRGKGSLTWGNGWGEAEGDYANFTVINFGLRRISTDGSRERSILIDCSRGRGVLHIYFLMNRLSGPRTTKYGSVNECLSDYGISVNITHPLRRITFGATLKRGGNKRDRARRISHSGVGAWRNVALICMYNVLEFQIGKVLDINLCVCQSVRVYVGWCVCFFERARTEDVGL